MASIIGFGCYVFVCILKKIEYVPWMLNILRMLVLLFMWVTYGPILQCLMYLMRCNSDSYHVIDTSMICYGPLHISLIVIGMLFFVLAVTLAVLLALVYSKTEPTSEDKLAQYLTCVIVARLANPIDVELMVFRTVLLISCSFDGNMFGMFLLKLFISIVGGAFLAYQYVRYLPYFDEGVSIMFGFLCFLYAWMVANALLTYVIPLTGHYVVIMVGVIPVYILAKNYRTRSIEEVLLKPPDKTVSELESIIQCYAIYSLINLSIQQQPDLRLVGLVSLHLKDCQKPECPLTHPSNLYDPALDRHVRNEGTENLHKNVVFLKHFAKLYFEAGITNYGNFPGIRIAYASFLLHAFKNIHASHNEITFAKKSKPNVMESIEIYKIE